jgi:glyoxylase-like metal-dependent hydrolase (beta-lactamase superfamily II)
VIKPPVPPLEDELGDVLDKAIAREGVSREELAQRSGVALGRILDAIDYRSDLAPEDLRRIAAVLRLNEVGLCALGAGHYPAPEIGALPFCVWPLRIPHGIGVANAYLVGECGTDHALLFDTGPGGLDAAWPRPVRRLDAVFLTHAEAEHIGGLAEATRRFGSPPVFIPEGAPVIPGTPLADGDVRIFGPLKVTAYATPGHAAAHHCYLIEANAARRGTALLISGDLVFAGSVGGAYFSAEKLYGNVRRILSELPPETVIAPGHGPMTTVANELRFNPFAAEAADHAAGSRRSAR